MSQAANASQTASRLRSIGLVSTVARILQGGIRALIIPLSIRILDTEAYGFWMVIASFVSWFSISDFGIAQMSTAQLAAAIGKDDIPEAKRILALALRAYGIVASGLALSFGLIFYTHLAHRFFSNGAAHSVSVQLDNCLAIVGLTFAANLVLNVSQVLNIATLQAEANYIASTLGPLSALLILTVGKYKHIQLTLTDYAFLMTLPTTTVLAAVFTFTLFFRCRYLLPDFANSSLSQSISFLQSSWPIVISQICDVVIYYFPPVVIAKAWGAKDVLNYSLPAALFMQGVNICYGWGQPHTAAYAQAKQRGNTEWILSRHRLLLMRTAGIFAIISFLFAFTGQPIINIYAAGRVHSPFVLLFFMALLYTSIVASQQNYFLLLGIRREKIRAIVQVGNAFAFLAGYGLAAHLHQMFLIPLTGTVGLAVDWLISRRAMSQALKPEAVFEATQMA